MSLPIGADFCIGDEDVRAAVGPLPTRDPIQQARYSAHDTESDRVATELEQLRAEVSAWRKRFAKLTYYGGQIIPCRDSDAYGPR